jgi:hypothetical protein
MKNKKHIIVSLVFVFLLISCTDLILSPFSPVEKPLPAVQNIASVPFFPVRGNHEGTDDVNFLVNSLLPAYGTEIHRLDNKSVNYYFDWKNIRVIVVDQFSEFSQETDTDFFSWLGNSGGNINKLGLKWVESIIDSAGPGIDHIFVAFHEPSFPRHRHINSSFDAYPANRDAFWKMLVRHNNKVRAVLVAHTHHYSCMRVKDPATVTETNYPDEPGGIYQIDVGTTGKEGLPNTIVEVNVKGKNLYFRTVQAENSSAPFRVIDHWSFITNPADTIPSWNFAYIGDNRNSYDSYKRNLEEIKNMTLNPAPRFEHAEFVIDGGDMDPDQENYQNIYLKVFGIR